MKATTLAGKTSLGLVFDPRRSSALLVLTIAAALWAAAVWREMVGEGPMDRFAVPLRFLALVATTRGLLGVRTLVRGVRLATTARAHRLVLGDTLKFSSPAGGFEIDRADLLAVVVDDTQMHFVVRPSQGHALRTLPAIFDASPALLAERIRKWRGEILFADALGDEAPSSTPSDVYDRAAAGQVDAGTAVVRHGRGWLRRGPYAALLFGLVFAEGTLRLPAGVSLGVLPYLGMAVCVAIPAFWWIRTRRELAPRRGVAFVATPAEVLMRAEGGVLRAVWTEVPSIGVDERVGWSPLVGREVRRKLRIDRIDAPPIRYEEEFLGAPAHVVAALMDVYRLHANAAAPADESE